MVSFSVKEFSHLQDAAGAVGYTQLAALATFNDQVNLTPWHSEAILVKRFTPQFHGKLLQKTCITRSPTKFVGSTVSIGLTSLGFIARTGGGGPGIDVVVGTTIDAVGKIEEG
jgi:hypothetical protein